MDGKKKQCMTVQIQQQLQLLHLQYYSSIENIHAYSQIKSFYLPTYSSIHLPFTLPHTHLDMGLIRGKIISYKNLKCSKPQGYLISLPSPESHFCVCVFFPPHFSSKLRYYWGLSGVWWGTEEVGHTWNRFTRWAGTERRGEREDRGENERKRPCNSWQTRWGMRVALGRLKGRFPSSTSHISGKLLMRPLITAQIKANNDTIN